jgi:polysaccharide biosynthesis protein PslH
MSLVKDQTRPIHSQPVSHAKGMTLLFVTSRYPYPLLKGDQVRAHHQIRELVRRGHKVILVTFDNGQRNAELEKLCQAVYLVRPIRRNHVVAQALKLLLSDEPLQLAFFKSREMAGLIRQALAQHKVEGAVLQLSRMGHYLPLLKETRVPVVLDLIDSLAMNIDLKARKAVFPLKLLWRLEAERLLRYEKHMIAATGAATIVSAKDRAYLAEPSVLVNPNGVKVSATLSKQRRDDATLLFHGNMSYYPNVEAARFLVREVMPHVWRHNPSCRILLVGANPASSVSELASDKVKVTGFVGDVKPYLQTATLGVYPILRATGIQNKILEAMSEGLPVITTQTVADGIEYGVANTHFYLAEAASVFADKTVSLLKGKAERERLSLSGRNLVLEHYTWEKTVAGLETCLLNLAKPS